MIRDADPARDAAACAAIYAPYVRDTVVTFEEEAPTAADFARRIAAAQERHCWLVAERDGAVVGYAYGGPFKERVAYRFTCEVSVYLDLAARGGGLGSVLYDELLTRLTRSGYRQAVGVVTQPNPASDALHARLGFTPAGTLPAVGWKHGAWRDVAWYVRPLGPGATSPPEASSPPGSITVGDVARASGAGP